MAMVSMRQLLDEAAKGGYGVGAFNVNNMEQIQAIMEAAREHQLAGDRAGQSRGARSYTNDRFLYHLMLAALELYPEIPIVASPGSRQLARHLQVARSNMGFTSVMMDGSLIEDGKTPVELRVQRRGHARSRRHGACAWASRSKASSAALGRDRETATARGGDGWTPDRSRSGRRVRRAHRHRRAGGRDRHQPRRLQVHAASRPATCWRWTGSRRSTSCSRHATW